MAKREQIWLSNNEHFIYCKNDLCTYTQFLHKIYLSVKFEVSIRYISRDIGINIAVNKYWCQIICVHMHSAYIYMCKFTGFYHKYFRRYSHKCGKKEQIWLSNNKHQILPKLFLFICTIHACISM